MAQKVLYQGDTVSNGPSGNIWHDCPVMDIIADPGIGYGFQDDFTDWGVTPTMTSLVGFNRYTCFGGATGTLTNDEALGGGLVVLTSVANEATSVGRDPVFNITSLGGAFWFEARVKTSTVTTNELAFFVGLMDTTARTATIPLTATGALGDVNLMGFHRPEANTTALDFSYKSDGVSIVEVNSNIGTLVADTYVKLGFKFVPNDAGTARVQVFVDNVKQAVSASNTIENATGTDTPSDVLMGPVFAIQGAVAPDQSITVDWWRCYQLRV